MKNISKWLLTLLVVQWLAIPVIAATGPFTAYQTLTAQALNNALAVPNITGGTIDNVVIGGNTPVSIYATLGNISTLNASTVNVTNNISTSGTVAASSVNIANALNAGTVSAVISATSTGGANLSVASAVNATNAVSSVNAINSTYALNIAGKTQYGILYQSASGVTASTTAGTTGQILTSNGSSAPTFQNATGATLSANQTFTGINTFSNASSTFAGNATTATTATTATNLLGGTALSSQFGIQPAVGYGGSVVQSGGTTYSVTLNKMAGQVTMYPFTGNPGTLEEFTIFNSMVTANDVVVLSSVYTSGIILTSTVATGVIVVILYIPPGITLGPITLSINFVVIKGAIN